MLCCLLLLFLLDSGGRLACGHVRSSSACCNNNLLALPTQLRARRLQGIRDKDGRTGMGTTGVSVLGEI